MNKLQIGLRVFYLGTFSTPSPEYFGETHIITVHELQPSNDDNLVGSYIWNIYMQYTTLPGQTDLSV